MVCPVIGSVMMGRPESQQGCWPDVPFVDPVVGGREGILVGGGIRDPEPKTREDKGPAGDEFDRVVEGVDEDDAVEVGRRDAREWFRTFSRWSLELPFEGEDDDESWLLLCRLWLLLMMLESRGEDEEDDADWGGKFEVKAEEVFLSIPGDDEVVEGALGIIKMILTTIYRLTSCQTVFSHEEELYVREDIIWFGSRELRLSVKEDTHSQSQLRRRGSNGIQWCQSSQFDKKLLVCMSSCLSLDSFLSDEDSLLGLKKEELEPCGPNRTTARRGVTHVILFTRRRTSLTCVWWRILHYGLHSIRETTRRAGYVLLL